jgi:hypothetical protein
VDEVEKILVPTGTGTSTPRSSSPHPVAILTTLSRLLENIPYDVNNSFLVAHFLIYGKYYV